MKDNIDSASSVTLAKRPAPWAAPRRKSAMAAWVLAAAVAALINSAPVSLGANGSQPLSATSGGDARQPAAKAPVNARVSPKWIGVAVENVPGTVSRLLGLQKHQGLLVVAVVAHSPAARSGLKPGDLLVSLDGKPLVRRLELIADINFTQAQNTCRLGVIRAGKAMTFSVQPSRRPGRLPTLAVPAALQNPWSVQGRSQALAGAGPAAIGPGVVLPMKVTALNAGAVVPSQQWVAPQGTVVTITHWTDSHGVLHCQMTVNGRGYPLRRGKIASLPTSLQPLARLVMAQQEQMQAASGHLGKHPSAMLLQDRLNMLQTAEGRLKARLAALQHYLQLIQAERQHDAKLLAREGTHP
ncbi:MAG: PDZ domain-containing protein [Phycisphaerales bacterium]|nr:PDZ domain-containing protein [Phycisphaerales bacterium]